VIAYKLGRSQAAAEMAATHTGALAGEDDVADAFLKDCGIARVGVLDALLESFPLALRVALPPAGMPGPRRVGVVTTTGGGAAMAVDQLCIRNVTIEAPSAPTMERLRAAGVDTGAGRVLDLTLAGTRYEVMKATLEIMLQAPEFDLVLAVVGSSARFNPQLAVRPIIECGNAALAGAKPLAALLVPDAPDALVALTAAGVPCYRTPESCADSIAAMFARRLPAALPPIDAYSGHAASPISEAAAYALLDQLGVPRAASLTIPYAAEPPALPFDYPVAVKVCSAQVPHKTEVGGVILGVADPVSLRAACATLRANLAARAPGVRPEEILIQPMRAGLAEVLIGYRVDAQAGPIIMLAAGGIWAEVAQDRSIRLAPVDLAGAREMIAEVRALQSLTGLRGKVRGDLVALAQALAALSQLALKPEWGVREAEINPLMVMREGQGVLAVDALVLKA